VEEGISRLGTDGQFDGRSCATFNALNSHPIDSQIVGENYGVAGKFYSHLVELDIATNQTQYRDALQQAFLLAQETRVNFSDPM
jgi:hypothetical protein